MIFLVQNKGNEHEHQIPKIWISLGTKFHFKQTTLDIYTKFAQKGYFFSKRENLNVTIEFSISESA